MNQAETRGLIVIDKKMDSEILEAMEEHEEFLPPAQAGFQLLRKVLAYHFVLAVVLVSLALIFPDFVESLPIGGVTELAEGGDLHISQAEPRSPPPDDIQVIETFIQATSAFDQLGTARQLMVMLISVWLLMLPVSWVHKGIHKASAHDHSLDETTLILPGIVASIVLVVQHSLALAFSLAGIVAGVHFRRALQDTFDALFILVAIGFIVAVLQDEAEVWNALIGLAIVGAGVPYYMWWRRAYPASE